ncbi:hypothetical protein M422DRAFT_274217 [Sphaerobolus stellatus SS14]|uniref:Uncharacterized protein n=1 Tax=Sphaerobolus stellatus (strain SS14) TaxID=990650 RepID=A0A0C9U728_SPHS4|nr:hypothetical protein M422DRAFT_274217 [Sphaerobolus stellatus SS14]
MESTSDDYYGNEEEEVEEFVEEEIAEDPKMPICDDKTSEGHRKVYARFGRRRANNVQLAVFSCGIIAGRATFYGSEGVNSVKVSAIPRPALWPQLINMATNTWSFNSSAAEQPIHGS